MPLPFQRAGFRVARRRFVDYPQAENGRESAAFRRFPLQDNLCRTRFYRVMHTAEQLRHEGGAGSFSQSRDAPHAGAANRLPSGFRTVGVAYP